MAEFLGDFGDERPAVDAEFRWLGETFRIHPDASDLGFMDFMAVAQDVKLPSNVDMETLAQDPAKAIAVMNTMNSATQAMHSFIRGQIHPEDWDRFMATAKAKRQQVSDLMRLSHSLTAAIARFPTGQFDASANTQSSTSAKSPADSLSVVPNRADKRAASRQPTMEDRAHRLLAKRPDLRLALVHQEQSRQEEEQSRLA